VDDFELEIKKEFISEGLVNLEETESAFMELETAPEKGPLLDKIFRMAHNMKGGSRAVGFGDVAEFTHILENFVLKLKKDELPLNSKTVTVLLSCNDRLIEMLNQLSADLNAKFNNADLIEVLNRTDFGDAPKAEAVEVSADNIVNAVTSLPEVNAPVAVPSIEIVSAPMSEAPSEDSFDDFDAKPIEMPSADAFFGSETIAIAAVPKVEAAVPEAAVATANVTPIAQKQDATKKVDADEVVRVSLSKIDSLNDFVGELIVLQSVIQEQAVNAGAFQLQASLSQMSKLSKEIQNLSMGLRMLPIKPMIQKLQRVIRDTSNTLGKEVDFIVDGDQIEVEKMVSDVLVDPLIHILRNAVDHGLEATSEDRVQIGKPRKGLVNLKFQNDGNHLVIEVKDDGKGINPEVVKNKAIEKGLITAEDTLSEKQIINLIFHAGFSTKVATTEVSGRGVGMDVVKTNIEKIGGTVDIRSTVNSGSIFTLHIPLSLAVIEGLIVTAQGGRFVIPLSQVQETINLSTQKIYDDKSGIGTCFELRGKVVPVVSLESTMGIAVPTKRSDQPLGIALVVEVQDQPIAFIVSDILRSQQIVVKPLDNGLTDKKGWIGTCILGDGHPTLILSPKDLLLNKFEFKADKGPGTGQTWRSA
jgi:two-component system chemotaxis sensor kinase CheA